jgi:hypothetical protein
VATAALLSLTAWPPAPAEAGKTPRHAGSQPRGATPDSAASATAIRHAPAAGVTVAPRSEPGLLRTTSGLSAVRLANGAMMLDLQGRYREYIVARIAPDGRPVVSCVHGTAAVRRALDPGAAAPAVRYEER